MDPLRGHASRLPETADLAGLRLDSDTFSPGANIGNTVATPTATASSLVDRLPAGWPRGAGSGIAMRVDPLDRMSVVDDELRD